MTDLIMQPMDQSAATEILGWTYEAPYDLYSMNFDDDALSELLNGTYYKVLDGQSLYGYCCFGESARVPTGNAYHAYSERGFLDMGLGMRPDLTGQGRGYNFVSSILAFAQSELKASQIRLTVAEFNHRAIALYTKLQFEPVKTFPRGDINFLIMEKNGHS